MDMMPKELSFIKAGQTWALVGDNDSAVRQLLNGIKGRQVEHVGFRHHFRNLSNTSDFYYQQRFNSSDSEDALTVHEFLLSQQVRFDGAFWNYGRVVRDLNLGELLSEEVIKLSNGETKRLLIAAALIRNPDVLVLDHPLTGLDAQTRKTFSLLLDQIVDSGITVVVGTGPNEIPAPVTHVAVVKGREIIFAEKLSLFQKQQFEFTQSRPVDTESLKLLLNNYKPTDFETIVRMTDVNVEYDGRRILSHITWHVKQGERWAVSGPNGAGKSTLLSLINADNPQAYANNIILFDRRRGTGESIWDIKKQTGFVSPELYQYFPGDSSCLHVIESGFYDTVGLFRASNPANETICTRWMTLLQIDQYKSRLFSMVPAGVQRLCLLARAIIKVPALLILDEPTQGLDETQQVFFTKLIDTICDMTNVTVIYVSHYEHHIPSAVTNRLRLRNGRIEA